MALALKADHFRNGSRLCKNVFPPPKTFRLIASAANQTHFKLVVVNNQNGEVAAFIDFENVFQFDQLVSTMATAIGHEPEGDFGAASQHVMNNVTVAELLAQSASPA